MIKSLLLIAILILPATAAAFGDDDYQIEKITPANVEFLFPPDSKLRFDGEKLKSKYDYHFVRFEDISGKTYSYSLDSIETKANYYYNKNSAGEDAKCFDREESETVDFVSIRFSLENPPGGIECDKNIEIILNYKEIFAKNKTRKDLVTAFNKIGFDLLVYLASSEDKKKLARSISQNIVEKVFELIPAPVDSTLARYGFSPEHGKSFILLNKDFSMEVDLVEEVEFEEIKRKNLVGLLPFKFNRSDDGFVEQIPYLLPADNSDNYINEKNGETLLASSADLQLSKITQNKKFFAVVNQAFKRNNENAGVQSPSQCRKERDTSFSVCNFLIASSDDLEKLTKWDSCLAIDRLELLRQTSADSITTLKKTLLDLKEALRKKQEEQTDDTNTEQKIKEIILQIENVERLIREGELEFADASKKLSDLIKQNEGCEDVTFSAFGERNLIKTKFKIWLNSNPVEVMFGATVRDEIKTSRFKLKRLYKGVYKTVENADGKTYLLPQDTITFK